MCKKFQLLRHLFQSTHVMEISSRAFLYVTFIIFFIIQPIYKKKGDIKDHTPIDL